MRALLLAAGRGTRISRYLSGNPKCTVDIGEEKLISYTIKMLREKGISEIGIVLGYKGEIIKEILKHEKITYFYNPFYDVTNSIASAWFAKEFIKKDEELMIMNADVYLESTILDDIISCKKDPVLFADDRRKEEADYKFKYENGILQKYGKELQGDDITGEYIGVAKLGKNMIEPFLEKMEEMINNQNHSVWWENILYGMVGTRDIFIVNVGEKFWAEVDYIEDYERILKFRGYHLDFVADVKRN